MKPGDFLRPLQCSDTFMLKMRQEWRDKGGKPCVLPDEKLKTQQSAVARRLKARGEA